MPKDSNPNFWWNIWDIQRGFVVELLRSKRHEMICSYYVNWKETEKKKSHGTFVQYVHQKGKKEEK